MGRIFRHGGHCLCSVAMIESLCCTDLLLPHLIFVEKGGGSGDGIVKMVWLKCLMDPAFRRVDLLCIWSCSNSNMSKMLDEIALR